MGFVMLLQRAVWRLVLVKRCGASVPTVETQPDPSSPAGPIKALTPQWKSVSWAQTDLVIQHLQLRLVLLQLCQLWENSSAEVKVNQPRRAQLGHPGLLWTQAVETLHKRPAETHGQIYTHTDQSLAALKTLSVFQLPEYSWFMHILIFDLTNIYYYSNV